MYELIHVLDLALARWCAMRMQDETEGGSEDLTQYVFNYGAGVCIHIVRQNEEVTLAAHHQLGGHRELPSGILMLRQIIVEGFRLG
jgi:hypothetical protein